MVYLAPVHNSNHIYYPRDIVKIVVVGTSLTLLAAFVIKKSLAAKMDPQTSPAKPPPSVWSPRVKLGLGGFSFSTFAVATYFFQLVVDKNSFDQAYALKDHIEKYYYPEFFAALGKKDLDRAKEAAKRLTGSYDKQQAVEGLLPLLENPEAFIQECFSVEGDHEKLRKKIPEPLTREKILEKTQDCHSSYWKEYERAPKFLIEVLEEVVGDKPWVMSGFIQEMILKGQIDDAIPLAQKHMNAMKEYTSDIFKLLIKADFKKAEALIGSLEKGELKDEGLKQLLNIRLLSDPNQAKAYIDQFDDEDKKGIWIISIALSELLLFPTEPQETLERLTGLPSEVENRNYYQCIKIIWELGLSRSTIDSMPEGPIKEDFNKSFMEPYEQEDWNTFNKNWLEFITFSLDWGVFRNPKLCYAHIDRLTAPKARVKALSHMALNMIAS